MAKSKYPSVLRVIQHECLTANRFRTFEQISRSERQSSSDVVKSGGVARPREASLSNTWDLPAPGDVIAGKYRVERLLGMGGMGAVFEATHTITNRRFALKWLLPQGASNAAVVKRFIREAKVAGRCQHRHIVEVYDIDQEANSMFMVMELLQGESLGERLMRAGRLPAHEACRILVPCMEGIEAAHAAGIVHRDIKPANIFLCAAGGGEAEQAKVLDFGVAAFSNAQGGLDFTQTHSGAIIGTPFYMAPEQMRGQPIDHRADVYALGVTLYELLSGRRPFYATAYADLILQIANTTPVPLEELVPDLPAGLAAIVRRAMAREATGRFATIREFIDALSPYRDERLGRSASQHGVERLAETPLAGETIGHGLYSTIRERPRWYRSAVGLLLMAAVLGGIGVLVWRSQQIDSSTQAITASSPPPPSAPPVPSEAIDPIEPKPATSEARATSPASPAPAPEELNANPHKLAKAKRQRARNTTNQGRAPASNAGTPETGSGERDDVLARPRSQGVDRATINLERNEF
jgi:serine/threonine-protein kinase